MIFGRSTRIIFTFFCENEVFWFKMILSGQSHGIAKGEVYYSLFLMRRGNFAFGYSQIISKNLKLRKII